MGPMLSETNRSIVLALLLLFVMMVSSVRMTAAQIRRMWMIILISCTILLVVALKGYFLGTGDLATENPYGVLSFRRPYFYLGISYLPATRNGEAFYFMIGLIAALRISDQEKGVIGIVGWFLSICFTVALLLTLARWTYVALAILIVARLKNTISASQIRIRKSAVLPVFTGLLAMPALYLYFKDSIRELPLNLISNAFLSIVNGEAATMNVSQFYTYSNAERVDIYMNVARQFVKWPFGYGVDNLRLGFNPDTMQNSESLPLDFLLIFGVFAIPLFLAYLAGLIKLWRIQKHTVAMRANYYLLLCSAIYALLNSPINEAVFWFAIGMANIGLRVPEGVEVA